MSDFWLYALLLGVFIVIALAYYAGKLLKQVAQQKEQQTQAKLAQQQALNKHDKKVFDSVLLITRAMQQEQCEFDERAHRRHISQEDRPRNDMKNMFLEVQIHHLRPLSCDNACKPAALR